MGNTPSNARRGAGPPEPAAHHDTPTLVPEPSLDRIFSEMRSESFGLSLHTLQTAGRTFRVAAGSEIVDWIANQIWSSSRQRALEIAKALVVASYLHAVGKPRGSAFDDSDTCMYQFRPVNSTASVAVVGTPLASPDASTPASSHGHGDAAAAAAPQPAQIRPVRSSRGSVTVLSAPLPAALPSPLSSTMEGDAFFGEDGEDAEAESKAGSWRAQPRVDFDLAIIGGGAAGLSAASFAAAAGARVALIDAHRLGGASTWTGSVPSKALAHVASLAHAARAAAAVGVLSGGPQRVDMEAVRAHILRAVAAVYAGHTPAALAAQGVDVVLGRAAFTGPRTLAVELSEEADPTLLGGAGVAVPPHEASASPSSFGGGGGSWGGAPSASHPLAHPHPHAHAPLLSVGGGALGTHVLHSAHSAYFAGPVLQVVAARARRSSIESRAAATAAAAFGGEVSAPVSRADSAFSATAGAGARRGSGSAGEESKSAGGAASDSKDAAAPPPPPRASRQGSSGEGGSYAEDYGDDVEVVSTPSLAAAGVFEPRGPAAGAAGAAPSSARPPAAPAPTTEGIAASAARRRGSHQASAAAPSSGPLASLGAPTLSRRFSSASAVPPPAGRRPSHAPHPQQPEPPPGLRAVAPASSAAPGSGPVVRELRASKFIIATGAAPVWPSAAIAGLEAAAPFVLTSETLWDNAFLPRRLVVVGAGPQGCEVAQAYRRLGADVTLIGPRMLPREDAAVRDVLRRVLYKERVAVVAGAVDRITVVAGVAQQLAPSAAPLSGALSPHAEVPAAPQAAVPRAPSARGSIGGGMSAAAMGGGRRRGDSVSAADGLPTAEVLALAAAAAAAAAGRATPGSPEAAAGVPPLPAFGRDSRGGPSPGILLGGPPSARTLSPPAAADAAPPAPLAPAGGGSAAYSRAASVQSPVPVAPSASSSAPVWVHVGERAYPADLVFLAVGRSAGPALAALGLDKAGVAAPPRAASPPPAAGGGGGGWAAADGLPVHAATLQSTTAAHVFAAGDCALAAGPAVADQLGWRSTHYAQWQGFHAARNALLPGTLSAATAAVPRVTYTDPQVATVGLSSEAALARYGGPAAVRVITQEADEGDRARIDGAGSSQQHGFLCVSLLRADGRILGATAVGAGAAEVVAEVSLAMSAGLSVADVALAMQPYPSHATALGVLARAAAADSLLESPVGRLAPSLFGGPRQHAGGGGASRGGTVTSAALSS